MTTTPSLVVVLFRLSTLDTRSSYLCNLYEECGLTKENLSQDLYNIVKSHSTSALYAAVTCEEIKLMAEEVSSDLPLSLLFQELRVLCSEIASKLAMIRISNTRLVGVDIQDYDTLAIIYNQGRT